MGDGHKPVIGHHGQKKVIQYSTEYEKVHLCEAACIGYEFSLSLDFPQHLGDGDVGGTYVCKGQDREEAVNGGVEGWDSKLTTRMISRFQNTMIMYMESKSPNMRVCSSICSDNPRR